MKESLHRLTAVPLPFQGRLIYCLQTPYEIKSPTCTRKHLNINITDTGKGNNRRWQATGGQREQRANSAGRFRHDCPRSCISRKNPSTSFAGPPRTERSPLPCGHLPTPWGVTPFRGGLFANAVKIKVTRLHQKAPEYQHYQYRQGRQSALASPRRTARATSEFRRTVLTWLH